jgi:type II secretory pathway component PulM
MQWWNQLQPRERMILTAGSIALVLILGYFQMYQPLSADNKVLRHSIQQQQLLREWMQKAAVKVKQSGAAAAAQAGGKRPPLLSLLSTTSRQMIPDAAFNLEERAQGRVTVETAKVNFDNLAGWLLRLERQHRVVLTRARLQATTDPGYIEASLTFE